MKIGIGIDTGGTCTDGIIYDLENKRILAAAKTPTTKENLSEGIGRALDLLPEEVRQQAEVIALSTTLATNACVENKGGRGKLIFLGIEEKTVKEVGEAFGLPLDDTLIFIPCRETLQGEIIEEPDWERVQQQLKEKLSDCQAVGIVELFANGTGAAMEKKTRELVEELGIPAVCGYELFQEKNVIGRGAGALLNARLIFVIAEFLQAVKAAMRKRKLDIPMVIVRSDGSLMNELLSLKRPIETLLCGPVASVMGAAQLHQVRDGVVIDMGGTTTDISLVRDGVPIRSQGGITVGDWTIYVKGMYVDTFGLGGDSEVLIGQEGELLLGGCRIMPIAMAADRFPRLRELQKREQQAEKKVNSWRKNIYVGLKEIEGNAAYSDFERRIAGVFYQNPMSLVELETDHRITLVPDSLKRLIAEGVLIRCGITPTDAMHVLGDYNGYDTQAAAAAMEMMAEPMGLTGKELSRRIYGMVQKKLYFNIVRILLLDKYRGLAKEDIGMGLNRVINDMYEQAARGGKREGFLNLEINCDVPLIGVGGPIGVFLEEVARLLGTRALIGKYANVANALGAIVANVEVCVTMEILPNPDDNNFRAFGNGECIYTQTREEAEAWAEETAKRLARAEALRRGAEAAKLCFRVEYQPVEAATGYGSSLFISEKVTAFCTASAHIVKPAGGCQEAGSLRREKISHCGGEQ